MCIYTSLVERTPGAGRHANFSAGVASASAINCCDTCFHSPSYPCQIPSGYGAGTAGAAKKRKSKSKRFSRADSFQSPSHISNSGPLQQGHEMQLPANQCAKRRRIKVQLRDKGRDHKSASSKMRVPLRAALIIVSERHAVRSIANPIHKPQRGMIESVFAEMILQQHIVSADSSSFPQ